MPMATRRKAAGCSSRASRPAKLARPEEIAPIVVYLAGDESRFATGQAFAVDGGITI